MHRNHTFIHSYIWVLMIEITNHVIALKAVINDCKAQTWRHM